MMADGRELVTNEITPTRSIEIKPTCTNIDEELQMTQTDSFLPPSITHNAAKDERLSTFNQSSISTHD